jgi:hypothetical protein
VIGTVTFALGVLLAAVLSPWFLLAAFLGVLLAAIEFTTG